MDKVGIGIIGTGGISNVFATSLKRIACADIIACASPTLKHVKNFASVFDIKYCFQDYKNLLELEEVDLIVIGVPNYMHAQVAIDAADAGKHVICTKPLCMNLREADAMIERCKKAKVKLMYGDNICFSPKYVKLKKLCDSGALGDIFLLKQSSGHDGPPSGWFWDVSKSGGWATVDLGCHSFEFFRWFYNNRKIESIYAEMMNFNHKNKGKADDYSIILINFSGGLKAIAEASWSKKGGFEDAAEVFGTKGTSYSLMPRGMTLDTYSDKAYYRDHYYSEEIKPGWSHTSYEEEWYYGFIQMFEHFINCVKDLETPIITGEDGKSVMEMIFASYDSASKFKKIFYPFNYKEEKPIDLFIK